MFSQLCYTCEYARDLTNLVYISRIQYYNCNATYTNRQAKNNLQRSHLIRTTSNVYIEKFCLCIPFFSFPCYVALVFSFSHFILFYSISCWPFAVWSVAISLPWHSLLHKNIKNYFYKIQKPFSLAKTDADG